MAKKAKPTNQEEPEEIIEGEEEAQDEKPAAKNKAKKIELDMTMDPSERLTIEMNALAENDQMRLVAKMLLDEFAKDGNLAKAYFDRKVTLSDVVAFIASEAKKSAVNNCAMISDETVYGWAIHFVQDGEVKPKSKPAVTVISKETEEELRKRAEEEFFEAEKKRLEEERKKAQEREERKRQAAIQRQEKKRMESGQMSLFDFMEEVEGGDA